MKDNQHIQVIPSTVLTEAQTKTNEVKTLLAPYLLALIPAERQGLPKMGDPEIFTQAGLPCFYPLAAGNGKPGPSNPASGIWPWWTAGAAPRDSG
jgi:hypothetical protein